MRLNLTLWLLGASSLASAHALHAGQDQASGHSLQARDADPGLIGDILGGLLGGLTGSTSSSRCPATFVCNGKGNDGYDYDIYGSSRPSWAPSGWKYFGVGVGWAPSSTFVASASFELPSVFLLSCSKVTWWSPSTAWKQNHLTVDIGLSIIPSWWNFKPVTLPSKSWTCSGKGTDGFSVDIYGNGLPSGYPSGWLYFGSSIGWAPPSGWVLSSSLTLPSDFVSVCGQVTWWKPSTAWLSTHLSTDLTFTAPSWWGVVSVPSKSWFCSGKGTDGWSVDVYGNGLPSGYPSGWLWFGSSIGWAPPSGWVASSSLTLPSGFVGVCGQVTWWKPSTAWLSTHLSTDLTFTAPSWWGVISPPARSWSCNGSGKDGWSIDWQGNTLPSTFPSGWLWFGYTIGWAPPAGLSISASLDFPSAFIDVCDQVTWFTPSTGWLDAHVSSDLTFTAPSWWGVVQVPSRSWKCSGTGKDGWTVDHQGNYAPSGTPSGWLWFGRALGWGPSAGWSCSSSFEFPSGFIESSWSFTWFTPSSGWIASHPSSSLTYTPPSFWGCATTISRIVVSTHPASSSVPTTVRTTTITVPPVRSSTADAVTTSSARAVTTSSVAAVPTTTECVASTKAVISKTTTKVSTTSKAAVTSKVTTTVKSTSKSASTSKPVSSAKPTSTSKPASNSKATSTSKAAVKTSTIVKTTSVKTSATTTKTSAAAATTKKPASSTVRATSTKSPAVTIVVTGPTHVETHTVIYSASTVTVTGQASVVTVTQTLSPVVPSTTSAAATKTAISPAVPSSTGTPSAGWTCDGSGHDGYEVDHHGSRCPSSYGGGSWLWFGSSIGWAPPAYGWSCGSSLSTVEISACGRISWWLPPAGFQLGVSQTCPFSWTAGGWIDTRIPSVSHKCGETGLDGFDFDHTGASRPSWAPLGFKWFGSARGWQPCSGFVIPASGFTVSLSWKASLAPWWSPSRTITVNSGFRCPKWWRQTHIRGLGWLWAIL